MEFVDTNVLIYAISQERDEHEKAARARQILTSRELALSAQVLQEFYVQATRASPTRPLSHARAVGLVEAFARFPVQAITLDIVRSALTTRQRYGISYWDAAILEAARALGCEVVLSEDLVDGEDYGGVRVANPFIGR